MIDFQEWYERDAINQASKRAQAALNRINDKPTAVTLKRGNSTLTAQTVRIEYDSNSSESESTSGTGANRKLTIFGIVDHATELDTDIRKNDRFVLGNNEYRVLDTILTIGEIQARCEVVS